MIAISFRKNLRPVFNRTTFFHLYYMLPTAFLPKTEHVCVKRQCFWRKIKQNNISLSRFKGYVGTISPISPMQFPPHRGLGMSRSLYIYLKLSTLKVAFFFYNSDPCASSDLNNDHYRLMVPGQFTTVDGPAKSCTTKRMVETPEIPEIIGSTTYQLVQDFAGPSTVWFTQAMCPSHLCSNSRDLGFC